MPVKSGADEVDRAAQMAKAARPRTRTSFRIGTMDIPVLIVGAGPAGLCTSIVLSRMGVRSILVEKHSGTSIYPKATGISLRTMELMRHWGVDQRVREVALDALFVNSIRETTLASPEVDQVTLGYPTVEESSRLSPVTPAVAAQDEFEPVLLEAARSYDLARVHFNTQLMELVHEPDCVLAILHDRETGERYTVRARYVIGADGHASTVRALTGIPMHGPANVGEYLSVLFRANLDHLARKPVRGLYSVRAGDSTGLLIPSSRDGRWFFAAPWSADRPAIAELSQYRLENLVHGAIGDPSVTLKLLAHQSVIIGAQVAERFREGNVFLVGDAAHRMTPTGGTGMNTAIHGAHNLSWKIGAVLNGWAGTELLDTYETERRPVGERNVARSIGKWKDGTGLALDLGVIYHSRAIMRDANCDEATIIEPFGPARVGMRVPHVALKQKGWRNSTIDISGSCLTFLAPVQAKTWTDAAAGAARAVSIPLETKLFVTNGSESEIAEQWFHAFGLSVEQGVLIRPDGHIAWATPKDATNAGAVAADAIARIVDGTANCEKPSGTTKMHAVPRPAASNATLNRRTA